MRFLNRLERRFGQFAIPNLTLYLVTLWGFTFFASLARQDFVGKLALDHDLLLAGEWWRLFTMALMPPGSIPALVIFILYFYFMMGTALEHEWGTFRYNLYLLVGYLMTVLTALVPHAVVTNGYILESVFLAFAWLYPEYTIYIFFILPCKAKWLALAVWLIYLGSFLIGGWGTKAQVAAGVTNFLLFFHGDIRQRLFTARRKFKGQIEQAKKQQEGEKFMHVCAECGVTDRSDPKMEFRYCPQCKGTPGYCIHHIRNHVHR